MNYFFIMNPGSHGGGSRKRFNRIFNLLDEAGINYKYDTTNNLEDAYTFSVRANKAGYDIIVAVGGDGTINNVLNGFYDLNGKRISNSGMGVIYTGTSPDFCKSYNIPTNINIAVKTLITGKKRSTVIGRIVLSGEYNKNLNNLSVEHIIQPTIKYFGCCVNIGLGASLARMANSGIRKYLGDFLGTFISLIKTVFNYSADDFITLVDGKKQVITKLYNLSIGRTKYIASGIKVKNNLTDKNRRFYYMVARKLNILNLPGLIRKVYGGKAFQNTDVLYLNYCNTIEVYGNNKNPEVEMDGDPAGFLPCKIEIAVDDLILITL